MCQPGNQMFESLFVLLTRIALVTQEELGEVTMESLLCGLKNLPTKLDLSMQQLRLVFERHCDCQVRKLANFVSSQTPPPLLVIRSPGIAPYSNA